MGKNDASHTPALKILLNSRKNEKKWEFAYTRKNGNSSTNSQCWNCWKKNQWTRQKKNVIFDCFFSYFFFAQLFKQYSCCIPCRCYKLYSVSNSHIHMHSITLCYNERIRMLKKCIHRNLFFGRKSIFIFFCLVLSIVYFFLVAIASSPYTNTFSSIYQLHTHIHFVNPKKIIKYK